ncbi:hypothetical protein LCGC14_1820770 [marine sediment metagenome]|uniref:Uncharacterized protein n=1 Tax=marine sediment metagenome TaxID=412755 RepID=A0A0F9IYU9_9ZZZZ
MSIYSFHNGYLDVLTLCELETLLEGFKEIDEDIYEIFKARNYN